MGEQTKNMLIGVFVLVACALVFWLVMFLKPHVGNNKETLYVRFSDINKINVGTRVMFAGKPVGEVAAIEEIHDARDQPTDELGRVYFYQLTLKVDSSVKVYNTDEISVQTSGLLGEKSIAIVPKAPPKGVVPKLITNQPVYAESVDPIEKVFNEINEVAGSVEETFKEATKWLKAHGEELASTVRSFGSAMDEIQVAVGDINQNDLVPELKTGIHNFAIAMGQVQDALNELHQKDAFNNLGDVLSNMDVVTADLASGKGTLGKLVKDDDLYLNTVAVMGKVNTLMNDINHYGILFNLNKGWQRTRLQRANLLNALKTPQEFKDYFETEVDQISTSMARLSMLIDKADQTPERRAILQSELFKKDFAELLRQANELTDTLKLYNQQLIESQCNPDP